MARRCVNTDIVSRIEEWLEDGGTGTRGEIALMFGLPKKSADATIVILRNMGMTKVVGYRPGPGAHRQPVEVLAYASPPKPVLDVSLVIANQPALALVWNSAYEPQRYRLSV